MREERGGGGRERACVQERESQRMRESVTESRKRAKGGHRSLRNEKEGEREKRKTRVMEPVRV
jgi:hypothetical protein